MPDVKQTVTEEISNALIDLMAEKPFTDITVSDVVRRAGVARASFYRNFSSTNEILDLILNDYIDMFKEYAIPVVSSQDERSWRAFLFRYIYYVNDHQHKLILNSNNNSNVSLVLSRLSELTHQLSELLKSPDMKIKYRIPARIGVINSVIVRWMVEDCVETPEELVDYLMGFILNI